MTPPDLGLGLYSLEADTVSMGQKEGRMGDSTKEPAEGRVRQGNDKLSEVDQKSEILLGPTI